MEHTQELFLVLGICLILAGHSVLKKYLNDRAKIRQAEINCAEQHSLIDHLTVSQEQETERVKVLAGIIKTE